MPMLVSVKQKIFNYMLDRLNQNTKGVVFDGNYMFRFFQQPSQKTQDFHIIQKDGEKYDYQTQRIVPVVEMPSAEITFMERNMRTDFELEYYIAIRVENTDGTENIKFDSECDEYQALLETVSWLKENRNDSLGDGLLLFKTQEPQKVNVFKYNAHYYQVVALSINATYTRGNGRSGDHAKWYMNLATEEEPSGNDHWLDTIRVVEITGKNDHDTTASDGGEQKRDILSRTWRAEIHVNFDADRAVDLLLLNESEAVGDERIKYKLRKDFVNDWTKEVYVISTNVEYENNAPVRIAFTVERAN